MKTVALIIAGGSGQRMQQEVPKQFLNVNDKPVIVYTMEAFERHPEVDAIAVVCIEGWETMLSAYARQFGITKLRHIAPGGTNGQSSIRSGLDALKGSYSGDDIVLIHDAIRPMLSGEIITDCIETARLNGTAITTIPCAEAMLTTGDRQVSTGSYPRENLLRTQTPQGFRLQTIWDAHDRAKELGITNSVASCTLMIEIGEQVHFSKGSEKNVKLTTPEDIEVFKALLGAKRAEWMK